MAFNRTKQRREWGAKDRAQNPEKWQNKSREYYKDNREHLSLLGKEWRDAEKESNPRATMIRRSRHRAKRMNVPFNLTVDDIVIPDMCPVLGIPLFFTVGSVQHNTPSIDRIDNTGGYTVGNIRVISTRANKLKNNATVTELELILEDLKESK